MPEHILEAKHLAKSYGNRPVVRDVSITIRSGEIVGLLGPNGAGKTSSFYSMVGLQAADHGNIFLDHQDISHLPMHKRAMMGVGYLPQEASIFRKLTVAENIMAFLEQRNDLTDEQKQQRLDHLLKEFHLGTVRDQLGISLSGGERRRAETARLMANEPLFVLLDEPFAGIDPISVHDLKRMIVTLSEKGIGVLITDHNVRETLGICHRAYIVYDGKILLEGKPDVILNDKQVRSIYLGEEFNL